MLNYVVKMSMMSAKYFKYYTIILRGGVFSWTHCSCCSLFFLFSFFPRLISASADWMFAILPHMVWP